MFEPWQQTWARCSDAADTSETLYFIWRELQGAKWAEGAAKILREARNNQGLDPVAGRCLAEQELATQGLKEFESALSNKALGGAFDQRYLEAYIRKLIKRCKSMPKALESKLLPLLREDMRNWGLYGYCLYLQNGREGQSNEFFEGLETQPGAEAWALFYFSLSLRWVGAWKRAAEVMRKAAELEEDNYRADILCWLYLDKLLAGQQIDASLLEHLQHASLEAVSLYALAANYVLLALLEGKNFRDDFRYFSGWLRNCQARAQPLVENVLMKELRKQMHRRLRASLPTMAWPLALYWRWHLGNHF